MDIVFRLSCDPLIHFGGVKRVFVGTFVYTICIFLVCKNQSLLNVISFKLCIYL